MKEKILKIAGLLLLGIFAWWAVNYYLNHEGDFDKLSQLSFGYLFLLGLLNLLSLFINGMFLKALVRKFDVTLGLLESFGISILSSFANYTTPFSGGAGFRAVYLKKRHGHSYSDFAAGFAGNYIINYLAVSITGILCLTYIYNIYHISSLIAAGIFGALFILLTCIILFASPFKEPAGFLLLRLNKILKGWNIIKNDKKLLLKLTLLSCVNIIISTLILLAAFYSVGLKIDIAKALLMNLLYSMSLLISITPGSLGIAETVLIFSGDAVGLKTAEVLVASLIIRAVLVALLFSLAPLCTFFLNKNIGLAGKGASLQREKEDTEFPI
ncbi:MAG: flippase-like domain-containing protein [Nitrospirae bacterium]|nr:flippase-like domain-containing protein [Nitrospirota bacterium]